MKLNTFFQKGTLALTALTLVSLSSCRDQDFDWDDAHATQQIEKFTNVFIKEFGKPAAGHQWGFDYADFVMGGSKQVSNDGSTRAVYKQDMNLDGVRACVAFGKPNNITQHEHDEVYAWFSNHRVGWDHPYSYYQIPSTKSAEKSQNKAKVINLNYADAGYGSLLNNSVNVLGDYYIKNAPTFHNGWVQNVASDDTNEKNLAGGDCNRSNMNYLYSLGLTADGTGQWSEHLNDFNAGTGWGWGKQPETNVEGWDDSQQNAVLILNAAIDTWTYESTIDGSRKHDKYYMVYLEGDDYAGWYLGFDLEGGGPDNTDDHNQNPNMWLEADGICNDWIIKISDIGNSIYNPARIMCEDLGGNIGVSKTDIDYNDIVLDVNYEDKNNGASIVKLTLQAAGGTLPLAVFYETADGTDVKLFEVHEFFYDKYDGILSSSDLYRTMINTTGPHSQLSSNAKTETISPKTYTLFVNATDNDKYNGGYDSTKEGKTQKTLTTDGLFSFKKLKIKVYRHGVDDYMSSSPSSTSDAEWLNLSNYYDEAPLKICIPQKNKDGKENKWLQERVMITDGYPQFRDWVKNSTSFFWNSTNVNYDKLYDSGKTTPDVGGGQLTPSLPSGLDCSIYGTEVSYTKDNANGMDLKLMDIKTLPDAGSITLTAVYRGVGITFNGSGLHTVNKVQNEYWSGYNSKAIIGPQTKVTSLTDQGCTIVQITVDASKYQNCDYLGFFGGWGNNEQLLSLRYK